MKFIYREVNIAARSKVDRNVGKCEAFFLHRLHIAFAGNMLLLLLIQNTDLIVVMYNSMRYKLKRN